jgi:hypothetical protein
VIRDQLDHKELQVPQVHKEFRDYKVFKVILET